MVDFPLDNTAFGASVLARCLKDSKGYNAVIAQLYQQQATWIAASDIKTAIINILASAGITDKQAQQCLTDKNNIEAVRKGRALGDEIGVHSTPSFFVMDNIVENNESKLRDAIDRALAAKK